MIALFLCLFLFFGVNTFAAGPKIQHEEKQSMSIGKEKNLSTEKTKEKKESEGKRKEKKVEFSLSRSAEKSIGKALEQRKNSGFQIEISLSDVLIPQILALEKKDPFFSSCRLYSNPPSLGDIGINFVNDGIIDLTTQEYYEVQAKQQGIAQINYKDLKKYVLCAFDYAEILQQVVLKMKELAELQDWLGFEDLQYYAKKALEAAIKDYENMESLKKAFITPCRWMGDLQKLRCGGVVVSFEPFSVRIGSLELWGHGKFAGLGGSWHVSSSFSLSRTFQDVLRQAQNKNEVRMFSDYIEKLESQGQLRKAALLKKKVLEQARNGHISLVLAPPGE